MSLNVTINGEVRHLNGAVTLQELLVGLGLDPRKIAVERNLEIVPRSTYDDVRVADGDKYEIVHFIGGGNAPAAPVADKPFVVAGREYKSRLIVGTGKYKSYADNAPRAGGERGGDRYGCGAPRESHRPQPADAGRLSSIRKNTPICRTRRAASPARMRCAPCGWRARRAAGISSSSKCWARRSCSIPT